MPIKLIAVDIDGTLVDDNKQLDTDTSTLLADLTDKGLKVVLCTGRPYLGAETYLKQMGFHKDTEQYVITHNGAKIAKADNSPVKTLPLDMDLVKKIMSYCLEKGLRFHLSTHEHMYTPNNPISPYTVGEAHHTNMLLRPFVSMEELEHLEVFDVMIADDYHLLDRNEKAIRECFGDDCEIVRSEPHFIEFMHPHAGKGRALEVLAQSLDIASHEVMVIGNAQNDISMLEFAGIAVAVGNAVPEVKAVSDFVTSSNNEQGVKRAIEHVMTQF